MNNIRLPSCHRYLSGDGKPDILYTLAITNNVIESSVESAKDFHALMVSEGVVAPNQPFPKQIEKVSCFQISFEHKCRHICYMCPYAPKNKNQYEMQESIILAFSLKNYENLHLLMDSGLKAEHLNALFLLNDFPTGKIVPTIPLFKLAYQYLLHRADEKTTFSELPSMITESLDLNNKGKLLPQNLQSIYSFLGRLQTGYKSISSQKALELSKQLQNSQAFPIEQTGVLSGFLNQKPPIKQILKSSNALLKTRENHQEDAFLPIFFSYEELAKTGFSSFRILENDSDHRLLETFLQTNPMLGAEIVTDYESNREMLLLCASEQFLYVEGEDEEALALIASYFSKSCARKQICMEPFRLYYFLFSNHIHYENVFSLHGAYKLLAEERGNQHTLVPPSKMVRELLSKEIEHPYSPYISVMPYYVKMYEVLAGHPLLQKEETKKRLNRQSRLEALMGVSYYYKTLSGERKPTFTMDDSRMPLFSYQPGERIGGSLYCVSFSFTSEQSMEDLIPNILYHIATKHLSETHGYKLLCFTYDSFTISSEKGEYKYLCDLVVNLATYLSEKKGIVPLFINETCVKS